MKRPSCESIIECSIRVQEKLSLSLVVIALRAYTSIKIKLMKNFRGYGPAAKGAVLLLER